MVTHQAQASKYISDSSKEFALYTVETRAIPRVADGLKDGQRKALWCLRNKAEQIKTIAASSLPIFENLYVHGDSSMADAISGLAAPYLNNICYLDGIGAFGSKLSPAAFGAPRYTHVRRSSEAQDLMFTDLDLVPLMENYDGSNFSAKNFLPIIPLVLLNGVSGVATGWSTDILPHKAIDLIDGCLDKLDNKKIKQLVPHFQHYDVKIEHIEDNSWLVKGRVEISDSTTVRITELPPGMKIEKFREELDSFEEQDKIKDYIDKSTEHVDIHIKLKREFLREATEEDLVDFFKIKTRMSERLIVIGFNDKIKVYASHDELFSEFVTWRLTWYVKRFQKLLADATQDLNYCQAIKACYDNGFPDLLRGFGNKSEVVDWVITTTASFDLSAEQISKIVGMPSYRWAKDSYTDVLNDIISIQGLIASYAHTLSHNDHIKDVYRSELKALKKKYAKR